MKEQGVSTIYLPINLKKDDLEKTINELINGVVYEDSDIDDDGLMVKAVKSKDIKVDFGTEEVQYLVVLEIWLKKDLRLTNAEANGEIAIQMSTKYSIQEDWQLKTKTDILHHHWLEKPKMKLGFLDLPIKFIANKIIDRSKDELGLTLDRQLRQRFDLRHHIQNAWSILQQPILLAEPLDLLLKLKPDALSMTPIEISDSEISSKVLVQSQMNVSFDETADSKELIPLPDFKFAKTKEKDFQIQLGAEISYKKIEALAREKLIGKTFTFEIGSVVPKAIVLKWQGERLLGDVRLSGSYEGNVRLTARPVFDAVHKNIKAKDLNLELNTDSILYRGIGWLFRSNLERKITRALNLPLRDRLSSLKELIGQKLQNHKINDRVLLNGQLEELDIQRVNFNSQGIEALFILKGNLALEFSPFLSTFEEKIEG